jgi:beta-galactosidase
MRVVLHPHGLCLEPEELAGADEPAGASTRKPDAVRAPSSIVPMWCGTMHYWRHPPEEWAAGLDAMRALGFRLLDTYVPWGVHELEDGSFDFGERDPRLDVARFLEMAKARGFLVIARPGPHINAELTYFGLPERIVWDPRCQARTPRGNPVMLPIVPVAFPVPSYASETFHDETERWFQACGRVLAKLRYPEGPIVLVQVDNEGALYFRDGPYDQDYHPDAVRLYRAFLARKYRTSEELRDAYGDASLSIEAAEPPKRFDAHDLDALVRHMDWMEFHEQLLAYAMGRFRDALIAAGLSELPTMHNFPLGEAATPLNPTAVAGAIDLVGLDYYHRASPVDHGILARRTSELVARCEGVKVPPFGAEVGAGFPPFFAPLDEKDSLFTLMAALAYGLRGYNLYMAVERDRWVGAPIDPHGRLRPFADAFRRLNAALERTEFHTLTRRTPVRLVVPRALRRLARATHAFGPATPALFNVLGAGFRESVLEEDFRTGDVFTVTGEAYLRAFERALRARGVPFAYVGGESFAESLVGATWVVCATVGGIKPELVAQLRGVARSGVRVTIGPSVPERDGSMRRLENPLDVTGLELEPLAELARADALVAEAIDKLDLPTYPIGGEGLFVTVHDDREGRPRVVFVLNPTAQDVTTELSIAGATALEDRMRGGAAKHGAFGFEISVPARTVRMFEVVHSAR